MTCGLITILLSKMTHGIMLAKNDKITSKIKDATFYDINVAREEILISLCHNHQENMSVQCIPPYTPLLYSKTGVRRGIPIFSYFCSKT